MKVAKLLIAVALVFTLVSVQGHAQVAGDAAHESTTGCPFAANLVYFNTYLGMKIPGPLNWYGCVQQADQLGSPRYAELGPGTRAIWLKYHGEQENNHPFNPQVTVAFYPNVGEVLSTLSNYVKDIPRDSFLTKPEVVHFDSGGWGTCSYRLRVFLRKQPMTVLRKIYAINAKDVFIVIEATDTQQEYDHDLSLFDSQIAKVALTRR